MINKTRLAHRTLDKITRITPIICGFVPSGICVGLSTDQLVRGRPHYRRVIGRLRDVEPVELAVYLPREPIPQTETWVALEIFDDAPHDHAPSPPAGAPRPADLPVAGRRARLGVVGLAEPPIRVVPRWARVVPGHEDGDMSSPIRDEVSP
jgi:hypothetical protein